MNQHTTKMAPVQTATTTRRGALRLLAGLAVASTGLAALSTAESNAKKKKSRKGKKGGNGICGDKRHARVRVPHDGSVVYTERLENGKRYRLRVTDHVTADYPLLTDPMGIDAGHIFRQEDGPTTAYDSPNGVDYGLSVDGRSASWGDYASNHVYERNVVGQGQKLALRLVTGPESALNPSSQGQLSARRLISTPIELELSGSLSVEILCD